MYHEIKVEGMTLTPTQTPSKCWETIVKLFSAIVPEWQLLISVVMPHCRTLPDVVSNGLVEEDRLLADDGKSTPGDHVDEKEEDKL